LISDEKDDSMLSVFLKEIVDKKGFPKNGAHCLLPRALAIREPGARLAPPFAQLTHLTRGNSPIQQKGN
jgi:hypothetical protein